MQHKDTGTEKESFKRRLTAAKKRILDPNVREAEQKVTRHLFEAQDSPQRLGCCESCWEWYNNDEDCPHLMDVMELIESGLWVDGQCDFYSEKVYM